MKLMKYSWLAALPMVFTACQDDMLEENCMQQNVYTLTASMDKGSADSRAQIVLNGTSTTKEAFHWNEGDKFSLFELDGNGGWLEHEFNISESYNDQEPTSSAEFSTSLDLSQGSNFVAFYPACETVESGKVQMTIGMTLPDNSKESWTEYFKNNMFMKAQGVVGNSSADTKVDFTQLCGIIRITYKNTSNVDRTFGAIHVDGLWTIGGYFQLDSDNVDRFNLNVTQKGDAYGLTFEKGATVKAGSSEDFYILFLYNSVGPESKPMSTVSVSDMDHRVILKTPMYSESLPVFQAGKSYWLNVTDNGKELLWSKNQQGSGEIQDEVTIDVSTYAELKQALATRVNKRLNVNIQKDIALEGPLNIVSPTNLEMRKHTLSLADNYVPGESTAVFDIANRLDMGLGTILGKDGVKLHDYYFALNGNNSNLTLKGVSLSTGTAIANAVFMDDDNLRLESIWTKSDEVATEVMSSIQTSGKAIHWVAKKANPRYWSYITANITGDICIESQYETLNTMMIFQGGTMNGHLICTNVNSNVVIGDYIRKADAVTIGSGYTGWDSASRYVENQLYHVSTFEELKTAIETPQELDESTQITLQKDIVLSSPLVITKPVNISGLCTMTYVGDTGAAITVSGNSQKEVRLDFNNSTLIVEGSATAIYVEDAAFVLGGSAGITVGDGGNALEFCANTTFLQPNIRTTGIVNGHVGFTANYKNDAYPNVILLRSGTINGDLLPAGPYATDVKVAFEGGTANGKNWADADINK